jgi:voltage-gated potassium channel
MGVLKDILRTRHVSRLAYGSLVLLLITLVGTVGYHEIGAPHATWVDSFYMTFITIATIGYGEIVDLSQHPMGRLFTVFISVVGIGTLSYLFSMLVALLIDADLNAGLRKKRMEKQIATLSGHYIICGIGRVGSNVAVELLRTKRAFVVIESDRAALDLWLEHHPETLHLHEDAADDDALQKAGVEKSAGVFAVTGDDSHNLMVALSVKMVHPKSRVVVRWHAYCLGHGAPPRGQFHGQNAAQRRQPARGRGRSTARVCHHAPGHAHSQITRLPDHGDSREWQVAL